MKDIWHTPYYNQDWSVNPKCKLFAWCKKENIEKYLQSQKVWI